MTDTPTPDQIDLLARTTGPMPKKHTSRNPQDSIPLLENTDGKRGYSGTLDAAAKALYRLLREHPAIRENTGKEVIANGKSRGHVPDLSRPDHASYLPACKIILHSLAHIASIPIKGDQRQSYVAIQLGDRAYRKGAALQHISHAAFKAVVIALTHIGWLELVPSHFAPKTGVRHSSRIRPQRPLCDWMLQQGLVFHGHPKAPKRATELPSEKLLRVRTADRSIQYLARPLSEEEAILPMVNAALRQQRLAVTFSDYATYERSYDFKVGRTRYRVGGAKDLYRVFSHEEGRGGRLYGHWVQRLPASLRQTLTINGKPTVELDFGGMQMALLYGAAGIDLPDMSDLYAVPGQNRDDMKMVLTRTVGNATSSEAVTAVSKALYRERRGRPGRAKEIYDAFWDHHAGVNPHEQGDTAPWAELQALDSRLALRILRRLHDSGITAIPIHDSFIVEARFEDRLRQVMIEEFEALTGLSGVAVRRA